MQTFVSTTRRASFSLLSHLTRQKPRFSAPSSSTEICISNLYPLSASPTCHLETCNRSSLTITCRQFQSNPCRGWVVQEKLQEASSALKKIKNLEDINSSDTTEDGIKEDLFGLPSLAIARSLDHEGENPEKILSYATAALKGLDRGNDKPCISVAMTLQLMGSANYYLKRFNECLGYLKGANTILCRLEEEGLCAIEDIRPVLHDVQLELANVNTAMGRREEALCNLKKCLEIKETLMEENSKQLGIANRDLAEAYVAVFNFKEALHYALKALEIHTTGLGPNSAEVAHDNRVLGVIHIALEDPGKAFFNVAERNQSSENVWKKRGLNSDHLLWAEIDSANMHIAFGRYQEAMNTLKTVVHQTAKGSETRALIFMTMGKALCNQDKFVDSKRCLSIAYEILKKKETVSPLEVAEAYSEMSLQYECMHESDTAISLLARTLDILKKIPDEKLPEQTVLARVLTRLGCLLTQMGEVDAALSCIHIAAHMLENSFGVKHVSVGYVYKYWGVALSKTSHLDPDISNILWSAEIFFESAKDILEASLGPCHADSIEVCQDLAKISGRTKSYTFAIELQERVVDSLEGLGPSARSKVVASRKLLQYLRNKACESSCDDSSSDNDPLLEL